MQWEFSVIFFSLSQWEIACLPILIEIWEISSLFLIIFILTLDAHIYSVFNICLFKIKHSIFDRPQKETQGLLQCSDLCLHICRSCLTFFGVQAHYCIGTFLSACVCMCQAQTFVVLTNLTYWGSEQPQVSINNLYLDYCIYYILECSFLQRCWVTLLTPRLCK